MKEKRRAAAKPSTNAPDASEKLLLKRIGLRIHSELYKREKPVEWLAFRVGIARSSIREIIAGRSNPRILTLHAVAKGLGYKNVVDFLSG